MSLRRSNVLEQDTGSEVDEDDIFDENDFMEQVRNNVLIRQPVDSVINTSFYMQDGSTETESDIDSSQMRPLIKVANGTARDLKKNSQGLSFPA